MGCDGIMKERGLRATGFGVQKLTVVNIVIKPDKGLRATGFGVQKLTVVNIDMKPDFQRVTNDDVPQALALMRGLYGPGNTPWSAQVAEEALRELMRSPEKGGAWLIRIEEQRGGPRLRSRVWNAYVGTAGYFVLTLAFSLEFGGVFALLDELYLRDPWRGRGIGSATLKFIEEQCRVMGAATLRLEAGFDNPDAVRFYESHGLHREQRHLMTKRLR